MVPVLQLSANSNGCMAKERARQPVCDLVRGSLPVIGDQHLMSSNGWSADIETDRSPSGAFVPLLVLRPTGDLGEPLRLPLEGEHPNEDLAIFGGLDQLAAMTRP